MSLQEALDRAANRLEATCSTCGNSYDPGNAQETHPYRHPIDGPVMDKGKGKQDAELASEGSTRLPSDPILRLVLIEKGLITVEDLDKAEAKLRASGMAIAGSRGPTLEGDLPAPQTRCDFCGSSIKPLELWEDPRVLPKKGHRACVSEALSYEREGSKSLRPPDPPKSQGNKVG